MKLLAIIVMLALLGGDPPQPSQAWREIKAAYQAAMANDPCVRREGYDWIQLRWSECLKFGPKLRMHGVWYYGFEESGFVQNVMQVPLVRTIRRNHHNREFQTFLDLDAPAALARIKVPHSRYCTHAIAIDFIGRRSAKRGAYYTGTNDEVIVVDQVIGGRFLGWIKTVGPPGWEKKKC